MPEPALSTTGQIRSRLIFALTTINAQFPRRSALLIVGAARFPLRTSMPHQASEHPSGQGRQTPASGRGTAEIDLPLLLIQHKAYQCSVGDR
ncbi:MAG TPA: hypothetical protein VGF67_16350 [Ktedonobacteraceae bacterium]